MVSLFSRLALLLPVVLGAFEDEECPANFIVGIAAERTHPTGLFQHLDPNHTFYRELADWGDEEIAAHWEAGAQFFYEFTGLDFRNVEPDPETGFRFIDGFMMVHCFGDVNLAIAFTSEHGQFQCPRQIFDSSLLLQASDFGTYHGTYGGEEGKEAVPGDSIIFGHYFVDLDDDPDTPADLWALKSRAPFRVKRGVTTTTLDVVSEKYGPGITEGKWDFIASNEDGYPHSSIRTVSIFPAPTDGI